MTLLCIMAFVTQKKWLPLHCQTKRNQKLINSRIMTDYTGKKVIIRADRAGVFFGTLAEHDKANGVVELNDCRRIWYWRGAASLSQMANEGVKNPDACKFTQVVPNMQISGVIEVLPCSLAAAKCIEEVVVWQR